MNTFTESVMKRRKANVEAKTAAREKLERDICSIKDPELREELMSAYGIHETIVAVVAA